MHVGVKLEGVIVGQLLNLVVLLQQPQAYYPSSTGDDGGDQRLQIHLNCRPGVLGSFDQAFNVLLTNGGSLCHGRMLPEAPQARKHPPFGEGML